MDYGKDKLSFSSVNISTFGRIILSSRDSIQLLVNSKASLGRILLMVDYEPAQFLVDFEVSSWSIQLLDDSKCLALESLSSSRI